MEYFCEDCKVCICHKCGMTDHNNHKKKDMQHAAEDIKSEMEKMMLKIKAKAVSVEGKMKEQTNLMLKSQEEIRSAEMKMDEAVEETIHLLNEHRKEVKMKLFEIREAQQKEHKTRIKHFQMVSTQIEKSAEDSEVFLQKIRGSEILESECAAVLSGLERLLNDVELEIYEPRCVTYQVNQNSDKKDYVLGKIVEVDSYCQISAEISVQESGNTLVANIWGFENLPFPKAFASFTPDSITKIPFANSIAVNGKNGNIAVAQTVQTGQGRVHLFASERRLFLRTIGHRGTGADLMDEPISVAFTSSGNIVVVQIASPTRTKLSVFTERGHLITDISNHLSTPRRVSVRNDGKLLVVDGHLVKVLSPDGANLIQTITAPFCDEFPCFAIHHQGMFFVSYDSLHCVKVFSDEGQLLYDIGCKGTGDGQLRSPEGLAIDKLNNLVVCDRGNKRLSFFSLEGKFVNSVTKEINSPTSVAVAKNGDLLYCDVGAF